MNNIKEFNAHPISRRDFRVITGPICLAVVLLTVIYITWEREKVKAFRQDSRKKLKGFTEGKMGDIKNLWEKYRPTKNSTSEDGSKIPSELRESSTTNTTEGPIAKLSSTVERAAAAIAIPKWRGPGNEDVEKTPDHQARSVE